MTASTITLIATTIVLVMCSADALNIPTKSSHQHTFSNRRQFLNHGLPSALIAVTTAAIVAPPSYAASDNDTSKAPSTTSTVVGQKAPTFILPNSRGEGATSLDQLVQSKKWTVLYFYPGAFTQGKWKNELERLYHRIGQLISSLPLYRMYVGSSSIST